MTVSAMNTSAASEESRQEVSQFVQSGPNTNFENCDFKRIVPNCFIWCCSQELSQSAGDPAEHFGSDYDSRYFITHPGRFSNCLRQILLSNVTHDHLSVETKRKLAELTVAETQGLALACFHGKVAYVEKKNSVIDNGQLFPYIPSRANILRPIFAKLKKYEVENEYRFVFVYSHPLLGVLSVQKEPLDLPILPITDK